MKKLILTLMLATFMSVSSVNAVEITCSTSKNLLKPNNFIDGLVYPPDNPPGDIGYYHYSYNGLIQVKPSTAYTYKNNFLTTITPRRVAVVFYDQDFHFISYTNKNITSQYHNFTFTTPENAYYITLHLYTVSLDTLNSSSTSYQLEEGKSISEFVPYEQCPVEEPEPEPLPADTTLDSFYSLYVSKIKEVSQYAIENKFLLGTVTLIILFIVLEIILKMFRKGGYR